jgi:hypothetical protein
VYRSTAVALLRRHIEGKEIRFKEEKGKKGKDKQGASGPTSCCAWPFRGLRASDERG